MMKALAVYGVSPSFRTHLFAATKPDYMDIYEVYRNAKKICRFCRSVQAVEDAEIC